MRCLHPGDHEVGAVGVSNLLDTCTKGTPPQGSEPGGLRPAAPIKHGRRRGWLRSSVCKFSCLRLCAGRTCWPSKCEAIEHHGPLPTINGEETRLLDAPKSTAHEGYLEHFLQRSLDGGHRQTMVLGGLRTLRTPCEWRALNVQSTGTLYYYM